MFPTQLILSSAVGVRWGIGGHNQTAAQSPSEASFSEGKLAESVPGIVCSTYRQVNTTNRKIGSARRCEQFASGNFDANIALVLSKFTTGTDI
jgi:hypothetical protein